LDYVPLHVGQQHPASPVVPVTIRAGERRERIDISLPRGTVISGRIVDEHGEPLQGVAVMASPWRRAEGVPALTTVRSTATDDRGVYRLIATEPDTYLVFALGPGAISGVTERAQGYAPIFYPGTPDAVAAQRVTLDTGLDATGTDIVFRPTPVADVTGTIVDAEGGPFAGPVALSVNARSGAPGVARSATADTNGQFVFRNVPPGEYVVKAPGSVGGIPPRFGARHVRVIDGDPPPVVVVDAPGASVEGRISVEGVVDADLSGFGISAILVDLDLSPESHLPIVLRELRDPIQEFPESGLGFECGDSRHRAILQVDQSLTSLAPGTNGLRPRVLRTGPTIPCPSVEDRR
jgi:hypothetical protein